MQDAVRDTEVVETGAAPARAVAHRGDTVPAVAGEPHNPLLAMVEQIMRDPSLPMERVHQAFEFYQKVRADDAKRAYDAAMAAAQAEFPSISKNRHVKFKSKGGGADTDYRHEDLAEIVEKCGPILARHGISHKWRTKNAPNEPITVTCVLTHFAGHSEENTLCGPRDESGNKNGLQGIASTVTYLERYTFKSAIGVASKHDDDGRAGGGDVADNKPAAPLVTEAQIAELQALMKKADVPEQIILEHFQAQALNELTEPQHKTAVGKLNKKLNLGGGSAKK